MKLSIRIKLVVLLALVALLPLVAAVLTIAIGGRSLRVESIGRGVQSVVTTEAITLQVSLRKDIEKLHLALEEGAILAAASVDRAMSEAELAQLDAAWGKMDRSDVRLKAVLDNAAASELRRIQTEDPRLAELLVTDRHGQLVAATGRTTDFYQADESWWKKVRDAEGRITYIPPVSYDASSKVWSVDICVPIIREGQVVGVGKAVLDLSRWLVSPTMTIGEIEADVRFATTEGEVLYGGTSQPFQQRLGDWSGPIASGASPGWRVTSDDRIQAFAPVFLTGQVAGHGVEMPCWMLVLSLPKAAAISPVTRLTAIVLTIGLAIIAAIFLIGLALVNQVVVRRVLRLREASQKVAAGDLSQRIAPRNGISARMFGDDEIDESNSAFNEMVSRIEASHNELVSANELKTQFIRVAGHELRSPVSYILGMVRLLKDSEDPTRLLHAMQSMGSKAKRLDEIIQSMFQLMPGQSLRQAMHYGDVNLTELIEEIHLDCMPFLDRRNQRLTAEGADRFSSFQADREKLRSMIENLVMNAIKFTPDGGQIGIHVSEELGGYVAIAISDQGPGVPEGELPHIFEPFFSGGEVMMHSSGRSGYEKRGIGLGLAIVHHFAEMHGGSVSVATGSEGSTFTVTVPTEPPPKSLSE